MLPTSLHRSLDRPDAADPIDGATDVIEAPTAEAAIAEVHSRWGPDARILDARRELRGGIGGFFAKEVVQLHVAPASGTDGTSSRRDAAPTPPSEPTATVRTRAPSTDAREPGSASVPADAEAVPHSPVDRLLADAPDDEDFAAFLRRRMGQDDPRTPTGPAAAPALHASPSPPAAARMQGRPLAPAPWLTSPTTQVDPAASRGKRPGVDHPGSPTAAGSTTGTAASAPLDTPGGEPGPAWSQEVLLQLGLPAELVRQLQLSPAADDVAWTTALATALTGSCGPVPTGPSLLIGPRADELSATIDVPAARSQIWFDALKEGRWLHLVVGGEGWREHLAEGPRVVSWLRPEDLPDAVRCAVELDLTLGFGSKGATIRRVRPLDVAVAIRELVDRR